MRGRPLSPCGYNGRGLLRFFLRVELRKSEVHLVGVLQEGAMKSVKINLAGRVRYLAFTVEAMFQIQEVFGGSGEMIEAIRIPQRWRSP